MWSSVVLHLMLKLLKYGTYKYSHLARGSPIFQRAGLFKRNIHHDNATMLSMRRISLLCLLINGMFVIAMPTPAQESNSSNTNKATSSGPAANAGTSNDASSNQEHPCAYFLRARDFVAYDFCHDLLECVPTTLN